MKGLKQERGFTLIEVIVVAGIIAVLAGILVPLIFKEIDESKISRTMADARSISGAMFVFRKDTGAWPVLRRGCTLTQTLLYGDGTMPTLAAGYDNTTAESYDMYLSEDHFGCWPNTWKGPYMAVVNKDPWGRAYITNAADLWNGSKLPVWVISAGPNGIIDTPIAAAQNSSVGDDVGIRMQ